METKISVAARYKGPWRVSPSGEFVISDKGQPLVNIVVATESRSTLSANRARLAVAELVSAAPDMFEALRELIAIYASDECSGPSVVPGYGTGTDGRWAKAQAAVSKALGTAVGGAQ